MTSPHRAARPHRPPAGPRRSWSWRDPRAPSPKPRAPSLMEIFRAPRVTLIARPEFIEPEHLHVQWRGDSSPGERLAEFAGRICYMSQHNPANRSTAEYLENIKKQGHGSVLEHAGYVPLNEGISRSCSHEPVRPPAGFRSQQVS